MRFISLAQTFLLCILSLSLSLQSVFAETALDPALTVTKAPLTIEVPPATLDALTPEARALLGVFLQSLSGAVQRVTGVQVTYPASSFPNSPESIISLRDLFISPDVQAELRELAGRKFTPEQLEQIHQTATYRVQSPKFHQDYVWQVSRFIQRGEVNIKADVRYDAAQAVYHLSVGLPESILGKKPLSFNHGAKLLVSDAIGNVFDLLVGLPQEVQALSESEVQARYQQEKEDYVFTKLRGEFDLRLFERDPTEEAPKPGELTGRQKRLQRISEVVRQITRAVSQQWGRDLAAETQAVRQEVEAEVRTGTLQSNEVDQAIADRILYRKNSRLMLAFRTSKDLNAIDMGLSELVANNAWAQEISTNIQLDYAFQKEQGLQKKRLELEAAHPILAQVPASRERESWIDRQLNLEAQKIDADLTPKMNQEIRTTLSRFQLRHELAIFKAGQEFDETLGKARLEELRERQEAKVIRTFNILKSWNPSKWVEQGADGKYYLNRYLRRQVASDHFGWRVNTFMKRWMVTATAWTYALIHENLWNGPVGIRSLVQKDPFVNSVRVDEVTGKITPDEKSKTTTLRSRMRALGEYSRAQRERFKQRESGVAGKVFSSLWVYGFDVFGVGIFIRFIGLPVAQLTVTLANIAVSAVGSTASVFPLGSLVAWAVNASLYNFEASDRGLPTRRGFFKLLPRSVSKGARRFLPLLTQVAIPAVGGTVELLLTLFGRVPWHAGGAGFYGLRGGAYSALVRRLYDGAVRQLINKIGRTVSRDQKFGEKLIEGPGMSSKFFFQVDPSLAILALQAQMESLEAGRIAEEAKRAASEPAVKLEALLKGPGVLVGQIPANGGLVPGVIAQDQAAVQKALAEGAAAQAKRYGDLLNIPHRSEIRFKAEDLKAVLQRGAALAEAYYQSRMPTWPEGAKEEFWKQRKLTEGDYLGLASQLLGQIFSPEVLTSLEETDKALTIEVPTEGLATAAQRLVDGVNLERLDERFSSRRRSESTEKVPVRQRVVDLAEKRDLCRPALSNLALGYLAKADL